MRVYNTHKHGIIYSHTEQYRTVLGKSMVSEEKLKKVCDDFSSLNEGQQDYILGILQALVFAKSSDNPQEGEIPVSAPSNN